MQSKPILNRSISTLPEQWIKFVDERIMKNTGYGFKPALLGREKFFVDLTEQGSWWYGTNSKRSYGMEYCGSP